MGHSKPPTGDGRAGEPGSVGVDGSDWMPSGSVMRSYPESDPPNFGVSQSDSLVNLLK